MSQTPDEREFLGLLDALFDEAIAPEQHRELERRLADDPGARKLYFRYVDLHLALRSLHSDSGEAEVVGRIEQGLKEQKERRGGGRWKFAPWALAAMVLLSMAGAYLAFFTPSDGLPAPVATLIQQAGAKFYGPVTAMPVGAAFEPGRQYAVTAGMVHVAFASGAEAIIQAPAVFEVGSAMRLVMKTGRCSVHAEGAAVGFVVDTPSTKVTDRGTRFSVDVDESGDAVVQVTEGKADVRPGERFKAQTPFLMELRSGMAQRYVVDRGLKPADIAFDRGRFVRRLPDRVVRYAATNGPHGGAQDLVDVTVQRGGHVLTYRYEDLIGTRLIHFKGADSRVHMTTRASPGDSDFGDGSSASRAGLLDGDRNVNTGIINPGGSKQPLTSDPVMNDPEDKDGSNTPGFAIRFNEPVVNDEGPDVVFFELQVITNPEAGDPFHVGPLKFAPGLHSHTIRRYDIDMLSPESATLADFRLYKFDQPIKSLGELERISHNDGPQHILPTKLMAVGIDLSDLGYAPGAKVDGLFFQDALDDVNYVDPVLIGGLPPAGSKPD